MMLLFGEDLFVMRCMVIFLTLELDVLGFEYFLNKFGSINVDGYDKYE